jgi:uncharacterized protein (TIGR00255 family)
MTPNTSGAASSNAASGGAIPGGLQGMTGFARAEGGFAGWRFVWEAKSVNGRGLDLKVRAPTGFDWLETAAREAAQARFRRGSVQLGLTLRREAAGPAAARLDHAFIEAVLAAGERYVLAGMVQQARWDGVLALRGAFLAEEDSAGLSALEGPDAQAALLQGLAAALDGLAAARAKEGAGLLAILTRHIDEIEALTARAGARAAGAPQALAEKLQARLSALIGEAGVDPQRLAQEIALLAAKADVREELDRLCAHIADARGLLASGEQVGRRLDFLTQEFNREANTLCSKSSDTGLTRIGLDLKAAIDQLREQAANVE